MESVAQDHTQYPISITLMLQFDSGILSFSAPPEIRRQKCKAYGYLQRKGPNYPRGYQQPEKSADISVSLRLVSTPCPNDRPREAQRDCDGNIKETEYEHPTHYKHVIKSRSGIHSGHQTNVDGAFIQIATHSFRDQSGAECGNQREDRSKNGQSGSGKQGGR